MPVALDVEGAAGKGKLDKKMVEAEEDISDFYLNSRIQWKTPIVNPTLKTDYSDLFKYDYQYTFEAPEREDEGYED